MPGKHFTLYSHKGAPNGWKVAFVLAELGLEYDTMYLDFNTGEHKAPEFTKINPNGRIPALVDHHNNDFTVWESCACILYLVEKYDKEHKISVTTAEEVAVLMQWLFFQASGQGPYYGQAIWFNVFHPEKVPTAVVRYQREAMRVLGVLEGVLEKQEWLVGGKCTVADISFVSWNLAAFSGFLANFEEFNLERDYPRVHAWHNKVISRPAIASVIAIKASLAT